jgi:predicted dehydrogenase
VQAQFPDIGATQDYDEIVGDSSIDAVVIATPVRFHYTMALKSLRAGKHIFIEKPMAASVAECMELIDIADKPVDS